MTNTPKPPKDAGNKAASPSERPQTDTMNNMALSLAEGFGEIAGEDDGLRQLGKEIDKAANALLSPELAAEADAVNNGLAELEKNGQTLIDDPALLERFTALQNNPEYLAAIRKIMQDFFELPNIQIKDAPTPGGMD